MKTLVHGLLAIILACGIGAANASGTGILTPKEAFDKARAGEMLLVDIRSPREWAQTGVPEGGIAETIHRDGGMTAFADALLARLNGDKSRPVALICATGNRSGHTRRYLQDAGFTNVSDVSQGMVGGRRGPGWQREGLPVAEWTPR